MGQGEEASGEGRARRAPRRGDTPFDRALRRAMRWYSEMGRRVWPYEILNYLFREPLTKKGPTVAEFWGAPQDAEEESMAARQPAVENVPCADPAGIRPGTALLAGTKAAISSFQTGRPFRWQVRCSVGFQPPDRPSASASILNSRPP